MDSTQKLIKENSYDLEKGLKPLFDRIGDARVVMLGEASHGTHEYYIQRARISQYLIEEKGFDFIAVEGDWPDCYEINRYVKHYPDSGDFTRDVLEKFTRWPTWMWANWEIAALMEWLHEYNEGKAANQKAGFYGLDVYSMSESMEAIVGYLKKNDPNALQTALKAMECIDPYQRDSYSRMSMVPEDCTEEIVDMLTKIRERASRYNQDPEAAFNMEQNAHVVANADKYYRVMSSVGPDSWNLRDEHMTGTLERLLDYHGPKSKGIIWEHNTHIGDARATDMAGGGLWNVGQLVRERMGLGESYAVGFGSYGGSVIAGGAWGSRMRVMEVPEARDGSWEARLHDAGLNNAVLFSEDLGEHEFFNRHHNHRAIGVVYDPTREKHRNYVPSIIPQRYDAFIYLDRTNALHPLKIQPDKREIPDTYPWQV